jgi:hypothetical protein
MLCNRRLGFKLLFNNSLFDANKIIFFLFSKFKTEKLQKNVWKVEYPSHSPFWFYKYGKTFI